jgi:hypothetical protein
MDLMLILSGLLSYMLKEIVHYSMRKEEKKKEN